jgi:hypothetical protein
MQSPFIIFIIFIFDTDVITSDSTEHWKKTRDEIVALQKKQLQARFWDFFKDPEKIGGMRKEIEAAVSLFQVGGHLCTKVGSDMLHSS